MRSVELFAGCGGLALGTAQAGFKHALVIEQDSAACETLRENKSRGVQHYSDWAIHEGDVRKLDYRSVLGTDQIALVSGGPPCQPFSIAGAHRGPGDPRNMWREAIRAVRELQPKAFLFENVRGLMRPAFDSYLSFLRAQLTWPEIEPNGRSWQRQRSFLTKHEKAGAQATYQVVVQMINAADYGAPQKRHRVIVMGVRTDVASTVTFPAPTHSREALLWSQFIERDYWTRHGYSPRSRRRPYVEADTRLVKKLRGRERPTEEPWVTVRDSISDLPVPQVDDEPVPNHVLHPGARVYPRHTGSPWDQPSKALKAGNHGVPGGENVLVVRANSVRYFTLREMARLQGFPDDFRIGGTWKRPIKQLGNAVPVQVGLAFGLALREIIEERPPHHTVAAATDPCPEQLAVG